MADVMGVLSKVEMIIVYELRRGNRKETKEHRSMVTEPVKHSAEHRGSNVGDTDAI